MKILLVSPLPPPAGGIATWTVKYQNYCKENDIALAIVNNAMHGTRALQSTAKRCITDEIKRTFYVLAELKRKIKDEKPDIVHLNTPCFKYGIFRDLLCVTIAKRNRIPVVVHCRCNIQDQIKGKLARSAFSIMVRKADKILTLNQRSFAYANCYAPGKVTVVPNYVETNSLSPRTEINQKIERVIYVGRVQKVKGAREIIQAAGKLPWIEFNLIGSVEDDIKNSPLPPNVILHGNQEHSFVLGFLEKSDIFLFPSYTEGFANALTEAMATGLPVITTDVGANKEMIEEKGGIIVPVGDSDAVVDALHRLNENTQLRKEMSIWNVEKVRTNYLQDAVMQKLLKIYKEVIT